MKKLVYKANNIVQNVKNVLYKIYKIFFCLIAVACMYVIGCVELSILPTIPTIGSVENPDKINNVLLNLSYRYFAGLIFYFFVSFLPYRQRLNKIKPAIALKIDRIHGKMNDSVRCLQPLTNDQVEITEKNLISLLKNTSVFSQSGYYVIGIDRTILEHLCAQRNEIKDVIKDLIEYKEYLNVNQLYLLEKIRQSQYFDLLNSFASRKVDKPNIREALAKSMYEQIINVRDLKKTI